MTPEELKELLDELEDESYSRSGAIKTKVLAAYRDLSALYASSQSHVAELLADNASLRAKVDILNEILNHIGQRLNIDIDPDVLESELDELADLTADLKTARDALVIGGRKRAKLEQALTEIRDLARTGLPPMSIPAEYWPEHKCNRIAAEANHALEGE